MASFGGLLVQLLNNVSLFALVAAGYVAIARFDKLSLCQRNIAIGLIFACGAILAMSQTITVAPGIILDGRSIMTGLVALFGGPLATLITVACVAGYRLWLGGGGATAGVASAIGAGLIGLAFHFLRVRHRIKVSIPQLLLLGALVVTEGQVIFLLLHAGGSLTVLLEVAVPLYIVIPIGTAILGIVLIREDERLSLQRRLRDQTQLFEAIFNSMSEGVSVADAKGHIIMVNSASRILAGVGPNNVPIPQWAESFGLFQTDGKTHLPEDQLPLARAIRGESTDNVEMVMKNDHLPRPIHLSVSGRPLLGAYGQSSGGVVVFRDVGEQREIQENLRRSEERFALAIAGSQDGIWDYNPVTGDAWYSPRFKALLGYRDDEFPNDIQFWKSRMLPEDHAASSAQFFDYEAGKCDRIDIIQRFRHKDGHLVYLSNRATGIKGDDGKIHRLIGAATDITHQKERENELAELLAQLTESQAQIKDAHDEMERAANLLRAMTDAMPALVSFVDTKERYAYCNKEYEDVFGVRTDDFVGRTIAEVAEAEVYEIVKPHIDKALRGVEVAFVRPLIAKGERRYIEQRYIPHIRADGQVLGFYAIGWDVTERHHREQHLSVEASTDPLTGLLNRRAMMAALAEASRQWQGQDIGGAILYLDVDHFKQINDSKGHDAGDAVLKTFAERIRSVVRTSDKVARLGGDEFVILLNARDVEDTAKRIATTLLERIQKPIPWGDGEIEITTSIGIALAERPDLTPEQVLTEADRALYEAKRAGRATFMIRRIG